MNTQSIYRLWTWLSKVPSGRRLFSLLIRFVNPYSGKLGASILELEPGYCRATLDDRRRIRNHLDSIHAIALTNFGELVSGLAVISAMPDTLRGIPVAIHIEFLKKARGQLSAECRTQLPENIAPVLHRVEAEIKNREDHTVAVITVDWKIGLVEDL